MVMINQRNQHSLPPVVSANHQLSTELTHALLTINAMVPIKPTPPKELRHARRLKQRKLSLKLMEKEKEMVMINQRNQHSLPPVVSANHQLSTELTHALLTINAMVPIKPTPLKEPRLARRLKLRKLSLKLKEKMLL